MSNLKVVNYLHITFDLSENSLESFYKGKQTPSLLMLMLTTLDQYLDKSKCC